MTFYIILFRTLQSIVLKKCFDNFIINLKGEEKTSRLQKKKKKYKKINIIIIIIIHKVYLIENSLTLYSTYLPISILFF